MRKGHVEREVLDCLFLHVVSSSVMEADALGVPEVWR